MIDLCDLCGEAMDFDEEGSVCDLCLQELENEEFYKWLNGSE